MENSAAVAALSALAQPTRLATMLALTSVGASGMRVGDIASEIGTPHNTMSAHLAILARAGLVEATKDGRAANYRAIPSAVAELSGFLAQLAVGR